jgi:hypothetical protein
VIASHTVITQIGQLIAEALIVTVGGTLCFSLGLSGAIRLGEARRDGQPAAVAAWGLLTALSFAGFAALVVLALLVVTDK